MTIGAGVAVGGAGGAGGAPAQLATRPRESEKTARLAFILQKQNVLNFGIARRGRWTIPRGT
jgi:hypothetical protein